MMTAYFDLNIFDRLEKLEKLSGAEKERYEELLGMVVEKKLTTAYSNAHLNDLFRGYQKNPDFIFGHLDNIKLLTNNLCICQYWGEKSATWHYRDIHAFFQGKIDEWEFEPASYDELFKGEPLIQAAMGLYKHVSLPPEFKKAYAIEPMFGIMFPLSKTQNNQYALQSDIYNFQSKLASDYGLYKAFKKYLITSLNKIRNNQALVKSLKINNIELPKHLELIDIFDAYTPNNKTSENPIYSKIIDTFFKYDLAGYKTDGHYNNMFDDALHTFYAAHFDFFITNDDRCCYKAKKTLERLNIKTNVIKIDEIELLRSAL